MLSAADSGRDTRRAQVVSKKAEKPQQMLY